MNILLVHERKGKQNNIISSVVKKPSESSDSEDDTSSSEDESSEKSYKQAAKQAERKFKPKVQIVSTVQNDLEDKMDYIDINRKEEDPILYINGNPIKFSSIDETIVEIMTDRERDEYVKLGQRLYKCMFDF